MSTSSTSCSASPVIPPKTSAISHRGYGSGTSLETRCDLTSIASDSTPLLERFFSGYVVKSPERSHAIQIYII